MAAAAAATTADLGVHLVGSICGADSAPTSFRKCAAAFPRRLRRLPDGEPAHRQGFIAFQRDVISTYAPHVLRSDWADLSPGPAIPTAEIQRTLSLLPAAGIDTGYDAAALESYAAFAALKAEGVVPKPTRFQVCVPPASGVMPLLADGYKAALEPVWESALLRALDRVQRGIPAEELAVQIDVASEVATLEGAHYPHAAPYYPEPLMDYIVQRIVTLVDAVRPDVEVGLHICYGDIGHEHFVQPKDTGLIVELATAVFGAAKRPVTWVHLPVPKDRDDEAYFAPLKSLELGSTELYLGLVHPNDEEGTQRRLETAIRVLGHSRFGVGSECGLGRTPIEEFDSIARTSTQLSSPVV
ncbi:hypothetical protein BFW01_g8087 [Lasiodiplodia theobromae]|nr:hypothetical protein BFW01_g8087 [Lasiodiplodia theobromae]